MARVIHFELVGKNPEALANSYSDAFDWVIEKWDGFVDYWLINTGDPSQDGIDGGLGKRSSEDEAALGITLKLEDCSKAVEQVLKAGGSLHAPQHAVPGVGWMAYCKDTDGNIFGLMQTDPQAK